MAQKATTTLSLNSATVEELAQISGIGERRAQMIVELREELGGEFDDYDELRNLPDFDNRLISILREHTVL